VTVQLDLWQPLQRDLDVHVHVSPSTSSPLGSAGVGPARGTAVGVPDPASLLAVRESE
jgi:hypothetical protein